MIIDGIEMSDEEMQIIIAEDTERNRRKFYATMGELRATMGIWAQDRINDADGRVQWASHSRWYRVWRFLQAAFREATA